MKPLEYDISKLYFMLKLLLILRYNISAGYNFELDKKFHNVVEHFYHLKCYPAFYLRCRARATHLTEEAS